MTSDCGIPKILVALIAVVLLCALLESLQNSAEKVTTNARFHPSFVCISVSVAAAYPTAAANANSANSFANLASVAVSFATKTR
jgi:hypothetical protein